ncbi:MAG: hypothetical protein AAGD01_00625 [Acidobacteriota bacterium]
MALPSFLSHPLTSQALRSTSRRLVLLVAAFAIALTLWPSAAEAASTKVWDQRLQEARTQVRGGDYQSGLQSSQKLLDDLAWKVAGGEGAQRLVGQALALRAVAQLGLGNEIGALWDWDVARSVYPKFQRGNLPSLGAGGSALKTRLDAIEAQDGAARLPWVDVAQLPAHQYQTQAIAQAEAAQKESGGEVDLASYLDQQELIRRSLVSADKRTGCTTITPAKLTSRRDLELPEGLKELLADGSYNVMLTVRVAENGLPSSVAVEHEATLPTAVQAATDYISSFRFEPTQCDGQPVAVDLRMVIGMSFSGNPVTEG